MSNRALRAVVEELERLAEKKAEIAAQEVEVKAAAKARGFSVKVINTILKLRKMTPSERAEYEGLLDVYKADLGMLDGTPLGKAARDRLAKKPRAPEPPEDDGGEESTPDMPPPEDGDDAVAPTEAEIEAARVEGAQAFRDNKDVLDNPYLADDPRRAAWDEGYCMEAGSDGMDLPEAWRPNGGKPKKDDPPGAGGGGDDADPGDDDPEDDDSGEE